MIRKSALSLTHLKSAGATVVSLSKNPWDLRPVVDTVVGRMMKLASQPDTHQTIALVGEEHAVPAHVLTAGLITKKLASHKKGKFAVGLEQTSNFYDLVDTGTPSTVPGKDVLKSLIEASVGVDAPMTRSVLYRTCHQHDIPTYLLDSRTEDILSDFMDQNDQMNHTILKSLGLAGRYKKIDMADGVGVAVRNVHMRYEWQRHTQNSTITHGLISCGIAHVVGVEQSYPSAMSLSESFYVHATEGYAAHLVPVLFLGKGYQLKDIPQDSLHLFEHSVVVTDAMERRFNCYQRRREIEHLQRLIQESGLDQITRVGAEAAAHLSPP